MTAPVSLDPRFMTGETRHMVAEAVRLSHDISLPVIPAWNDKPCLRHAGLAAGCMKCGVRPRRHQRVGGTWLFLRDRAGLFDSTGLGKTVTVAVMLALMLSSGELTPDSRKVLVIARAATITQWRDQLLRMIPGLRLTCVTGDARSRARALGTGEWEVALCGPEMMVSKASKAIDQLMAFEWGTVICDDISALSNVNKTSRTIRHLTDQASRVVVATATPLDKRLGQLYDTGRLLGWPAVLGSEEEFRHRYVNMQQAWYTPKLKPVRCRYCKGFLTADHAGRQWVDKDKQPGPCPVKPGGPHFPLSRLQPGARYTWQEKGVNAGNLPEFKARLAPLVLRRTAADCDDVNMPAVELTHELVELGTAQKARYDELKRGILTRIDDTGKPVTRTEASSLFLRARQITSGLANLDGKGDAAKLERAVDMITGDLSGEPVVVYCYFRPTLQDLADRLRARGVHTARIWGEQHASEQDNAIKMFSTGAANVMLITDAGGMGLNLQRARRMILVDPPLSQGRLSQLVGRIKRDGGTHQACYVKMLLSDTPLDKSLAEMLGTELETFNAVMGGTGGDFQWPSPEAMLRAVTG